MSRFKDSEEYENWKAERLKNPHKPEEPGQSPEPGRKSDNIIKKSIAVGILIVSISIGYYYIVYMPELNAQKERELKEQSAKTLQKSEAEDKKKKQDELIRKLNEEEERKHSEREAARIKEEFVEWTLISLEQEAYHPLIIIGNFLVEFLRIHPFQDGNGRVSRIISNLLLLKVGYLYMPYISHEKLIEDHKPEDYLSLRKSQKTLKSKTPNINSWLEFFLSIILEQSKLAVELSTVNQVLDKLLRLKKIERLGLGRSTRYRKLK